MSDSTADPRREELPVERSLDPDDWSDVRALGHEMVDDMIDFLRTVRERPVWKAPPAASRAALDRKLPRKGTPLAEIYAGFREHVMPYSLGNTHPRFWGWVNGTGTATGMLADLLAAGLNAHVAFGNQAPNEVERRVIAWMVELLGLPASASGILVSSGSVANLTGLTVGRDTILPDVIQRGIRPLSGQPTVYGSDETHNSVDKMVGLLGLGREAFRRIPIRPDFTADIPAISRAIADDRARGMLPFAIVGTAGTVATGAIDDLVALADLATREGLWFHVDAAFGAALALSPKLAPLLAGIERADSIAFDFHKWFYVPYDAGCVLVRDGARHERSFSPPASYLASMDRGIAAGGVPFGRLGVDLSRGFRALKVWMSLLEHGADRYGELVEQNVAQAAYLADRIRERPELELLAPVPLNVVCFRHRPPGVDDPAALDRHNQEILMELHERGIAAPSFATIRGAFAIRAAITNHRSRREDFDAMVEAVVAIGREITGS